MSGFSELSVQEIKELDKITSLDLRNSNFDISQLELNDETYSKIKRLGLGDVKPLDKSLDQNQYDHIISILSSTDQIAHLFLENLNLTAVNLEELSNILNEKEKLIELSLKYSNLSSLEPFEKLNEKLSSLLLYKTEINGSVPYAGALLPYSDLLENSYTFYSEDYYGIINYETFDNKKVFKTPSVVRKNEYTTVIINGNNVYFGNSLMPNTYGNYDEGITTWNEVNDLDKKSYTINGIDYSTYTTKRDTDKTIKSLDGTVFLFPKLEELYINNCDIDFNDDCTALKYFKNLKTIHINNCGSVDCKIFEQDNLAATIEHIAIYNTSDIRNQDILDNTEEIKLLNIADIHINGKDYLF